MIEGILSKSTNVCLDWPSKTVKRIENARSPDHPGKQVELVWNKLSDISSLVKEPADLTSTSSEVKRKYDRAEATPEPDSLIYIPKNPGTRRLGSEIRKGTKREVAIS